MKTASWRICWNQPGPELFKWRLVPTWRELGLCVGDWLSPWSWVAWIITSEVLKRFIKIFIKTVFNKNNPKCFCWKIFFQSIEFLNQSIKCDSYFCFNWNTVMAVTTELGQTNGQIQSIEWFVQLIKFWQLSSF